MKPWKKVSSKWILQDRWLNLRADVCALPNGKLIEPFYVMEEKDWAHIAAFDDRGRILITKQYRYPSGVFCLELPCGCIEPGEDALLGAQRELKEETGYEAKHWEHLLSPFANPARQTNRIQLFLATDLKEVGPQELDETEEIEWMFMTVDEVKESIRDGRFGQSLHIGSFYFALERLNAL